MSRSGKPRRTEVLDVPADTRGHRFLYDPESPGRLTGARADVVVYTLGDEPLSSGAAIIAHGVFACATCGAHPGFDLVEPTTRIAPATLAGDVVGEFVGPVGNRPDIALRAKTDCLLPQGAPTVSVLEVSSGRVVLADSLSPVIDADLPETPGYSSAAGQIVYSARMSALGVVRGAVGSSGATLARLGPAEYAASDGARYVLGKFDDEAEPGEEGHLDLASNGGAVLASISTQVWAYAITDYDNWAARAIEQGLDPHEVLAERGERMRVVDLPRGTYLVVHHQTVADADPEGGWWPSTYADITMIHPR
ncbi:hypothetical protein [Nocardioides sp. Leaf285]|uniref:hypothetical protein n=1 Tax=Nocardioides sp. Leaf285 TaxID=1736322 RepID=UPI000A8BCBDC|nr:hypothetical protein [Nocardioides sp. Leaf285]